MKPSGPGLLFVRRILITVSVSVLVMGLLRFSISSWFSFGICIFINIHQFHPSCPFYCHIVADSSLYDRLCFCVVCWDFSIFISNFVDLVLLSFFLDEYG